MTLGFTRLVSLARGLRVVPSKATQMVEPSGVFSSAPLALTATPERIGAPATT
jgi:hypothetical protein